jgi:hypothetical protein
MADKIFNDFQGNTIKIDGVCYTFVGETTSVTNSDPSEIDAIYASCLACAIDSSSSSSSSSDSSESIGNVSSSSSSPSSESLGNFSSSSSDGVIYDACETPCDLTVQFKTFTIPDGLKVIDNTGTVLDTGAISTGNSFNTYNFTDLECPVKVCVTAPTSGTAWELIVEGCGMHIDTTGGQVSEICFEPPELTPLAKVNCTGNSDPRMKVTVCWTGGNDTSGVYNFLGESGTYASFSNGESKIVCPTNYSVKATNNSSQEGWTHKFSTTGFANFDNIYIQGQQTAAHRLRVDVKKALQSPSFSTNDFRLQQYHGPFTGPSSNNLSLVSVGNTAGSFGSVVKEIESAQFHYITASTASHGNITIKWSPIAGNAIGTDTWASWEATTLATAYKATVGYEGCP